MLATVTQCLYILLETSKRGQPDKGGYWLPLLLTLMVSSITAVYIHFQDPVFHQIAYAAILLASVGRMEWLLRTRLDQTPFEFKRNLDIRGQCRLGCFLFATAFLIWNCEWV
jgi:dihydroceramidase